MEILVLIGKIVYTVNSLSITTPLNYLMLIKQTVKFNKPFYTGFAVVEVYKTM